MVAAALAGLLVIAAAPALAAAPDVYKVPFVPSDLFDTPPVDGTVSLVIQVWTGSGWVTDGLVVVPAEHVLPVECSVPMRERPLG